MSMKFLSPVARRSQPAPGPDLGGVVIGRGSPSERARKGRHPAHTEFDLMAGEVGAISSDPSRRLTTSQLWQVYWRVPDVRAAIDSVVRRIATVDWTVAPIDGVIDPRDQETQARAAEAAAKAVRWLRAPMMDKTWQQFMTMLGLDLLVYDAGVIEPNEQGGRLLELVPRRGDDFWPIISETGVVERYDQVVNGKREEFSPEDLIVLNLYCNTTTPRGMPIIETLLDQVIAVMRASERAMLTMDASEIPPGVMVLFGIAGKAAQDTVQSFIKDKGKDHRMRVLHFPSKGAGEAKWLKLDHTPKELQMVEVVTQVRRTIWRLFGVFPVEMGETDGMPRATAQVQLDASSSHLLRPILELLQEVFTTRVLPKLIDEEWLGTLEFRFDWTRELTPEEERTLAEADKTLVDAGLMTRNEIRLRRGLAPAGPEADELTVTQAPVSLKAALEGSEEEPSEDPVDPEDEDGGDGPDGDDPDEDPDPEDGAPGESEPGESSDEEAPGEADSEVSASQQRTPACRLDEEEFDDCVARKLPEILAERPSLSTDQAAAIARSMCSENCSDPKDEDKVEVVAFAQRAPFDSEDLPSDWQPAGRFRGYRTLDLSKLGAAVSRYARTVRPIWDEMEAEFRAKVRAAYADGQLTGGEAAKLTGDLDALLNRVSLRWEAETEDQYVDAARVGLDFAEKISGMQPQLSPREVGLPYRDRAMGWLVGTDGPIESARRSVAAILGAVARSSLPPADLRAKVPDGVEPGMEEEALLASVSNAIQRERHRIDNWSGRLVQLGNSAAREAMLDTPILEGEEVRWFVEWVDVGDGVTCATCSDFGGQGFIELRNLPTTPGGDTECRARCRCVLVYWTEREINGGEATLLGGTNTGDAL